MKVQPMRLLAWFVVAGGILFSTATQFVCLFVEVEPWRKVGASVDYAAAFIVLMLLKPEWFREGDRT
jgi:hypothetical protein